MTVARSAPLDRPLIVRADATTESGTGHMMRTLALAQAWLDAGGRARWLVADGPAAILERIAHDGIDVVSIAASAGSRPDADALRTELGRDPEATAVVDGVSFDEAYLDALADTSVRVLLIADRADRARYPVGFLLNQNAHADRSAYPADATCRFLLGTRYVLLRREFIADPPPRATPGVAHRILVTFGGADPTAMTARTVEALRLLPDDLRAIVEVRFIIGAANADGPAIASAVASPDLGYRASLERAVDDMPARMAWADLAITSGGSTVWELARTGCPALVVETVPLEQLLVTGLDRVGLFGRLGPEAGLETRRMANEIAAKAEDMPWRAAMSELGTRLVDGRGARRVVAALAGRTDLDEEGI
jgi:UDP-2,4-diacetamido-2,4,6-trideoxy-beta-L-altropyranose hydrolase